MIDPTSVSLPVAWDLLPNPPITDESLDANTENGLSVEINLVRLMIAGPPEIAVGTLMEALARATPVTYCSIGVGLMEPLLNHHLDAVIDWLEATVPQHAPLRRALSCCSGYADTLAERDPRVERLRPARGSPDDVGR